MPQQKFVYEWGAHIKNVCALLRRDGSGWTSKAAYAVDKYGNSLQLLPDTSAVQHSLLGANYSVLYTKLLPMAPTMTREEFWALTHRHSELMVKLYSRVGLVPDAKSVGSTALLKFGYSATWPDVKRVLTDAYAVALRADERMKAA